ncbi:hypothetical protein L7F22_030279 [Adiantum nelumboides]|nr:hypothetical protein [Adiantum nelumboides]
MALIPYPRAMLQSTNHHRYNFLHSSTQIVVERVFGRLKEIWKFLGGTVRCRLPSTMQACCILHNMLVDLVDEPKAEVCQIEMNDPLLDNPFAPDMGSEVDDTPKGIQMREILREYLDAQGIKD